MADPTLFDPTHAVRFDLQRGAVLAAGEERQVVMSCAALDDFVLIAGTEAAAAVGRSMAASFGKRVASRLGGADGVNAATIAQVVSHLAGELALAGLGALSVERWGRAVLVVVDRPAVSDLAFLASIVEGAIEAATGRPARCASLGRDSAGGRARILVASESAIERARAWIGAGIAWGDVLARLQPKGGGA